MKYVYESPDSGKTIYRRLSGDTQRELVHVDPDLLKKQQEVSRWLVWQDILKSAKDNPALQEALDRAQIIYELGRRDNH